MTTTLILALALTLALGMILVPAIGTIVFAQNMSGNQTMTTGVPGNMTSNMTSNMSG